MESLLVFWKRPLPIQISPSKAIPGGNVNLNHSGIYVYTFGFPTPEPREIIFSPSHKALIPSHFSEAHQLIGGSEIFSSFDNLSVSFIMLPIYYDIKHIM